MNNDPLSVRRRARRYRRSMFWYQVRILAFGVVLPALVIVGGFAAPHIAKALGV